MYHTVFFFSFIEERQMESLNLLEVCDFLNQEVHFVIGECRELVAMLK